MCEASAAVSLLKLNTLSAVSLIYVSLALGCIAQRSCSGTYILMNIAYMCDCEHLCESVCELRASRTHSNVNI